MVVAKNIINYCNSNILILPQALREMQEATCLIEHGNSAIFYKSLHQNLVDVEFFCNSPCFVFTQNGREKITSSDDNVVEISKGTVTFLPQGTNLHSDYVRSYHNLQAYLLFFENEIIQEFLSTQPLKRRKKSNKSDLHNADLLQFRGSSALSFFFESITNLIKNQLSSPLLLRLKLLEFLHILTLTNPAVDLETRLSGQKSNSSKRNIKRLLNKPEMLRLTVTDLAMLSGRSLSSFNRDFRASYHMPPQKWLRDQRLSHAQKLLIEKNLSVTEVALEIGYENTSHFIKTFKEKFNLTPKELQKMKCDHCKE